MREVKAYPYNWLVMTRGMDESYIQDLVLATLVPFPQEIQPSRESSHASSVVILHSNPAKAAIVSCTVTYPLETVKEGHAVHTKHHAGFRFLKAIREYSPKKFKSLPYCCVTRSDVVMSGTFQLCFVGTSTVKSAFDPSRRSPSCLTACLMGGLNRTFSWIGQTMPRFQRSTKVCTYPYHA